MASIPPWMERQEAYRPPGVREAFLEVNALALVGLLSRGRRRGPVSGRLDPQVKVLCVLLVLVLVTLTRSPAFLATAGTALLVLLAFQDRDRLVDVLRTTLAVGMATAIILLPTLCWGGRRSLFLITAKVLVSVGSVKLLTATTAWARLCGAFRKLGLPDLFLLVFEIAVRYLTLLGELALAMLQALRARSVGRDAARGASLAAIAGTLYLKSREMAEAMHAAMVCRGYGSEGPGSGGLHLGAPEAALALGAGILTLAFLFLGS